MATKAAEKTGRSGRQASTCRGRRRGCCGRSRAAGRMRSPTRSWRGRSSCARRAPACRSAAAGFRSRRRTSSCAAISSNQAAPGPAGASASRVSALRAGAGRPRPRTSLSRPSTRISSRREFAFEGRSAAVTLDASESPLDWLRRRKDASGAPLIDEACHQAGERLRLDLTLAAMLPRVTANWDAAVSDKARGAPRDPASLDRRRGRGAAARRQGARGGGFGFRRSPHRSLRLPDRSRGDRAGARLAGALGQGHREARARPPRRSLRARPRGPRSGSLARRHGVAERRVAVSSRARTISARLRRRRGRRA